jgi:hypothetical protein
MLGGSGYDSFSRGVVEKGRHIRDDRAAVARERPVPSRIKERAEAMVDGNCG